MAGTDYECECCGEPLRVGDGTDPADRSDAWPCLGFRRPDAHLRLSPAQARTASLDDDHCMIWRGERIDCFMRVTMTIPVVDDPHHTLDYGPWAAMDLGSFGECVRRADGPFVESHYDGALATAIPGYEFPQPLPVRITARPGRRPWIVPAAGIDHPLARDVRDGITRREAELRIRSFLLPAASRAGRIL